MRWESDSYLSVLAESHTSQGDALPPQNILDSDLRAVFCSAEQLRKRGTACDRQESFAGRAQLDGTTEKT